MQGPSVHKWWEIATQYKDSSGTPVAAKVVYGKSVTVGGSYNAQLGDGMDRGTNNIQKSECLGPKGKEWSCERAQ